MKRGRKKKTVRHEGLLLPKAPDLNPGASKVLEACSELPHGSLYVLSTLRIAIQSFAPLHDLCKTTVGSIREPLAEEVVGERRPSGP